MKKLILLPMFIFLILSGKAQETNKVGIVTIKISSVCEMCKERIENKLNYTRGIVFAEVNLEEKTVEVKFKSKIIGSEDIKLIISNLGYHADDVNRNEEAFKNLPKCCRDEGAKCEKK